jgi:hypothetical protein
MTNTVCIAFLRCNPPTLGHERLFNKLIEVALANDSDYKVYPSQTQDEKNPLTFEQKLGYLEFFFPYIPFTYAEDVKTVFDAMYDVDAGGYNNVIMIAGEDRVEQFDNAINPYVKRDLLLKDTNEPAFKNIESFIVLSAGDRDPDSDNIEGISASKLREAAKNDDYTTFYTMVPSIPDNVSPIVYEDTVESMFNDVRKGLGL